MRFTVRKATEGDFPQVCAVLAEADALHREALPNVFRQPDGPVRTDEFLSGILADGSALLLVAEQGGRVVGMVHACVRQPPDIPMMVPRRYVVIDTIAVAADCRARGIGRALMQRVHRWAREHGTAQVELNVWEFNQGATAFYEKLGYTTASRRMCHPLQSKEGEDGRVV